MIPLCKDEWLESLPSFEEEEEEDEATPRDFASPPLLKETYSRRLSRGSLSKLPSDVASRSQADWDNHSEATTEAGDGEIRRMGGFEGFFQRTVPVGLGCIYYIADLEGPVDPKLLEHALRQCVKRHPNLRARLTDRCMESIPFEECPPIHVPLVRTKDVVAFTEERMKNSSIKTGSDLYMWEVALHETLPSSSTSPSPSPEASEEEEEPVLQRHLVLLAHHAILDGDSILKLLQELIATMAKLHPMKERDRRAALRSVEPLRQLPSQDELLYENYRGYYVVYHVRTLLRELFRVLRLPRVPRPFRCTTDLRDRTTRILSFTMPAHSFKRLMATCKREGTTVTGAISAACMRTVQQHIPHEYRQYVMKLEVLVNFRGMIQGVQGVEDALQLFAAPVDVMVDADVDAPVCASVGFWDMARTIKTDIDAFAKQPHLIMDTLDLFRVLGQHPLSWPILNFLGRSTKQGRYKAMSVSNLGRTDGRFEGVGGFSLGRLQMGIDELLFGHTFFLALASHKGDLNMTLSYAEPIVSRDMAQAFVAGVVRQCEEACEDVPAA